MRHTLSRNNSVLQVAVTPIGTYDQTRRRKAEVMPELAEWKDPCRWQHLRVYGRQ